MKQSKNISNLGNKIKHDILSKTLNQKYKKIAYYDTHTFFSQYNGELGSSGIAKSILPKNSIFRLSDSNPSCQSELIKEFKNRNAKVYKNASTLLKENPVECDYFVLLFDPFTFRKGLKLFKKLNSFLKKSKSKGIVICYGWASRKNVDWPNLVRKRPKIQIDSRNHHIAIYTILDCEIDIIFNKK